VEQDKRMTIVCVPLEISLLCFIGDIVPVFFSRGPRKSTLTLYMAKRRNSPFLLFERKERNSLSNNCRPA